MPAFNPEIEKMVFMTNRNKEHENKGINRQTALRAEGTVEMRREAVRTGDSTIAKSTRDQHHLHLLVTDVRADGLVQPMG